jgi:predicted  nucleic acid-binding Zn-ribbon protein
MDDSKYDRELTLLCPTCGSSQFAYDNEDESGPITCADCARESTRDQLILDNQERIDLQLKEIGEEVVADAAKELNKSLKDAFRGNKSIRFK